MPSGVRPDITVMVDWALKTNNQSINHEREYTKLTSLINKNDSCGLWALPSDFVFHKISETAKGSDIAAHFNADR